jgi:glucokinase
MGNAAGNKDAAVEAYRQLGVVTGDAIAQALTLVDGLVVIGGGISPAWPLFMPALIESVNGLYEANGLQRLPSKVFNLEDPTDLDRFLRGDVRHIPIGTSGKTIAFDPMRRTALGLSRLGTNLAVAVGARAFALRRLDHPA